MENADFSDNHFNASVFKKKPTPGVERGVRARPNGIQQPPRGKIILNDDISKARKSKTSGLGGDPGSLELGESTGENLSLSKGSSSKQETMFGGLKNPKSEQMSRSGVSSLQSASYKSGGSQADTGAKTEQMEEESDELTQSHDKRLEEMQQFRKMNQQLLTYLYDEELEAENIESYHTIQKIEQDLDAQLSQCPAENQALLKSSLQEHLNNLEKLKKELEERELQKSRVMQEAEQFKLSSKEVAEMPEDYEEVVERIAAEITLERKLKKNEDKSEEVEKEGEPEIIKKVRQKLSSTMYGFANTASGKEKVKQTLDDEYQKKIERVRDLDRLLREKELEEKAVKKMIKERREQDYREIMEKNKQEKGSIDLDKNTSAVSNGTSKSDFFMTQNRKIKKKIDSNSSNDNSQLGESRMSASSQSSRQSKRPGKNSSQVVQVASVSLPQPMNRFDHIQKNIENAYASPHDRFLNSLSDHGLKRYHELCEELESCLEEEDNSLIKANSEILYQKAYGYPEELKEKFRDIDEQIIEMNLEDKLKGPQDVIRERAEQREVKRKLKALDQKLKEIQEGKFDPTPEEVDQKVEAEIGVLDQNALAIIKEGIDLSEFDEWESMDREGLEMLQNIDVDAIEKYLAECLEAIESTEKQIKEEEEQSNNKESLEKAELEQQYLQKYLSFLEENKSLFDKVNKDIKFSNEEDLESYESKVIDALKSRENQLDEWYQHLEQGKDELNELEIENCVLKDKLQAVSKTPDALKEAEEYMEYLKANYPEVFEEYQQEKTPSGEVIPTDSHISNQETLHPEQEIDHSSNV